MEHILLALVSKLDTLKSISAECSGERRIGTAAFTTLGLKAIVACICRMLAKVFCALAYSSAAPLSGSNSCVMKL